MKETFAAEGVPAIMNFTFFPWGNAYYNTSQCGTNYFDKQRGMYCWLKECGGQNPPLIVSRARSGANTAMANVWLTLSRAAPSNTTPTLPSTWTLPSASKACTSPRPQPPRVAPLLQRWTTQSSTLVSLDLRLTMLMHSTHEPLLVMAPQGWAHRGLWSTVRPSTILLPSSRLFAESTPVPNLPAATKEWMFDVQSRTVLNHAD